ncbi:hypothetical protein CQ13_14600 [Bradyrhizobium retamae]|uniref:Amine oxidase n=1 Tax=Bradyrhizobium retamae TaxID=1300035 RepID=A0A0R3NCG0_9BRAD|nr:hypothetical protein [Bradyrhizobium retamae]KRR30025.1 hypothetical protein CQ13_14600 [Bradyrhizobium retamae]
MIPTKPSVGTDADHPLDPLSEAEVALASEILKKEKRLGRHARFTHVQLEEPAKSDVLGWEPGVVLPRRAAATLFDCKTGATHVATVDLESESVTAWREYSTKAHPYGQPPITIEEVFKVGDIVKSDADWRRAMKRRGLDDKDIELVQVDPFSAGYFDREVEKGRRLVSAVSYWRRDLKDNGYAHPIEGVVALVDLIENRIVHLVNEPDIIPIPKKSRNYDQASIPQTRKDVKPLDVVQKDGPSFTVEGWKVGWQNWSFRVGWTAREGLVLHQISFRDGARERPIIYRASVTDIIVPYADPTANHFWKCAFDVGEYGLGKLANALSAHPGSDRDAAIPVRPLRARRGARHAAYRGTVPYRYDRCARTARPHHQPLGRRERNGGPCAWHYHRPAERRTERRFRSAQRWRGDRLLIVDLRLALAGPAIMRYHSFRQE